MRKILAVILVASLFAVSVPRIASADEQEDLNWSTVAQFSGYLTPEERCAAVAYQSAFLWGSISWLSSMVTPSGNPDLDAMNLALYGPALLAAYAYSTALGFTYWWYSCNQF